MAVLILRRSRDKLYRPGQRRRLRAMLKDNHIAVGIDATFLVIAVLLFDTCLRIGLYPFIKVLVGAGQ